MTPVRSGWVLCLVLGVAFLVGGAVAGAVTVHDATEIAAYHRAAACPHGAPLTADCRQSLAGTIVGVTEIAGKNPDFALDVRTADGVLHAGFNADSPLLSYALNGEPAVITVWRGRPVDVSAGRFSSQTANVPATATARALGTAEIALGVGAFFLLGGIAARRRRNNRTIPVATPTGAAAILAVALGSLVIIATGVFLSGDTASLGSNLTATAVALAVVAALAVWLGVSVRHRNRARLAGVTPETPASVTPPAVSEPSLPRPPHLPARMRLPARTRLHPRRWRTGFRSVAALWLLPVLTVGVLFGVFRTAPDGAAARAYREAPACAGEADLASCAGDFTAVVNGVRSPVQGQSSFPEVSFVTAGDAINAWATFDTGGNGLSRVAASDQLNRTLLVIKVWRRTVIGADLGGRWLWAENDPPGDAIPAIFLAVCFTVLLLVVRVRAHVLARRGAQSSRRLLVEDAGQAAAGAFAIALMALGFWPGAVVMLAVLGWCAVSMRAGRISAARRAVAVG